MSSNVQGTNKMRKIAHLRVVRGAASTYFVSKYTMCTSETTFLALEVGRYSIGVSARQHP